MAYRPRLHVAVFAAPAVMTFTAVMIWPLSNALRLSLDCAGEGDRVFSGRATFATLFADPRWSASFWNAPGNNAWFVLVHMLMQDPIGVALAAIRSHPRLRFAALYPSAIFFPTILGFVIVGFAWTLILPAIGIISILTFVVDFNAPDLIHAAQGALVGPDFATEILGSLPYRTCFGFQLQPGDAHMGATIAGVLFAIILAGVGLQLLVIQSRMRRHQF